MKKSIKEVSPHTQIIHFKGGYKRTICGVIRIWENEMTHLMTIAGTEWIINKENVLCVEKIKGDLIQLKDGLRLSNFYHNNK